MFVCPPPPKEEKTGKKFWEDGKGFDPLSFKNRGGIKNFGEEKFLRGEVFVEGLV